MGEEKLFQICYEGDLTIEVCDTLRKLGAQPNFDQGWMVRLPAERHAAPMVRYLKMKIGADARLLVAQTQYSLSRDFLLVRHSQTPGADYRQLHGALQRLGNVLDLPFDSTFVIQTEDRTDVRTLGEALSHLSPDGALMVVGISHDFAFCTGGLRRMFVAPDEHRSAEPFRSF